MSLFDSAKRLSAAAYGFEKVRHMLRGHIGSDLADLALLVFDALPQGKAFLIGLLRALK